MKLTDVNRVIVPISGGKDSQATLAYAVDTYGASMVTGVHDFTGIDHSLTYKHMSWMSSHYGVPITFLLETEYTDIFDMIEKREIIPSGVARVCTDEFKIQSMNRWLKKHTAEERKGMLVLMGMRAQESPNRMDSYGELSPDDVFSMLDLFPSKSTPKYVGEVRVQLPIVHRSTPWVFEFFRLRNEPINPLYARGFRRVGCFPCVLSGKRDFRLAARDPEGRAHLIRLDSLRTTLFKKKGIEKGSEMYDAVLSGMDIQAILKSEDPANRKGFDLTDNSDLDDEEDHDSGCAICHGSEA